MKVTANIRRLDLVRMNLYLLPRLKINWIVFPAILVIFLFIQLLGLKASLDAPKLLALAAVAAIGAVAAFIACAIFSMIFFLLTASKKSGLLGEHEFEVRPDGLFERTNANEQLSKWSGVHAIHKSGSFIYVQISSYLFHLIPRRSFDSTAQFQEFHEQLQSRWKAAVV